MKALPNPAPTFGGIACLLLLLVGACSRGTLSPATPVRASSIVGGVPADEAASYFVANCASCHSIGGGDIAGPDLAAFSGTDADSLKKAIQGMDSYVGGLDEAAVGKLTTLLLDPKAAERVAVAPVLAGTAEDSALPGFPDIGRALFTGSQPLANRGPECAGCHDVDGWGGKLATGLAPIGARLGEEALAAAIHGANFKVMREVYGAHPISSQEARHLAAYIGGEAATPAAGGAQAASVHVFGGVLGALLLLGLLRLAYARRHRSARDKLRSQLVRSSIAGSTHRTKDRPR